MRNYFILSSFLHVIILGGLAFNFSNNVEILQKEENIPIELIFESQEGEKTRLNYSKEKVIQQKNEPKQKAVKGKQNGSVVFENNDEQQRKIINKIKDLPQIPKKPVKKNISKKNDLNTKKLAASLNKVEEKTKIKKNISKKNDLEPKKLAALLNKVAEKTKLGKEEVGFDVEKIKKIVMKDTGNKKISSRLTHTQIDMLKARISACWNPPVGINANSNFIVTLKIFLNVDGSLAKKPETDNKYGTELERIAVESAKRAVSRCSPYSLPRDNYESWKVLKLNFDPTKLLR